MSAGSTESPQASAAREAALSARHLGIQGLGWIVRRTTRKPAQAASFYHEALRLPSYRPIRSDSAQVMLWAGDLTMLELSSLQVGAQSEARLEDLSIVLRATHAAPLIDDLVRAGASLSSRASSAPLGERSSTTTLEDPLGRLLAIREGPGALETTPAARLPDVPWTAAQLGDVHGIALAVEDPLAMAAFYASVLGLQPLGTPSAQGATLSLGRRATLDLLPGGRRYPPPRNRNEVPDVWILRVFDHAGLSARLRAHGVTILNVINFVGGLITYALDPEGHLFGLQQRTPDLLRLDEQERHEDALANSLWARGA